MSDDQTPRDGVFPELDDELRERREQAYARQERNPGTEFLSGFTAGIRRWVDAMGAQARRQAAAVAASKLRSWVNETHEDRPTRGELRAWVTLLLDERGERAGRLNKAESDRKRAEAETEAVAAQRDSLVEALDAERVGRAKWEDAVAKLGDERDQLRRRLVQAQRERDAVRVEKAEAERKLAAEHADAMTYGERHSQVKRSLRSTELELAAVKEDLASEHRDRLELADELGNEIRKSAALADELARAQRSADARGDYVLVRLLGEKPEPVEVTNWEEDDAGRVHVDGHRTRVTTTTTRITIPHGSSGK